MPTGEEFGFTPGCRPMPRESILFNHNPTCDVPTCEPGTPVEQCTHEIWGVVTPGGDNLHMAAVHFHCHAPTCLAMEIRNNLTGELICRQEPIYGGTGKIDLPKFDEPGYI